MESASTCNNMINTVEQGFSRLRRFTGDVSHELRTPLSIIKGGLNYLFDERERQTNIKSRFVLSTQKPR